METKSTCCATCQGINIKSLAQAPGYQHLSLDKLHRSREICRVCDSLCAALEDPECCVGDFDTTDIWNDEWSLNMRLSGGLRPNLQLTASTRTGWYSIAEMIVYTDEDDPAVTLGLRPLLSLPSNTRSRESYATARRWLGECLASHARISGSEDTEIELPAVGHSDSNHKPRRLVHVHSCETGLMLRLVDALSVSQAYVTLSHCVRESTVPFRTKLT